MTELQKPLYALTVGEYISLHQRILKENQQEKTIPVIRQPDPDQLLTISEAAQILHLSVPTMYSKVSKGELPVMKRGKRLYFSKKELIEFML